MDFSTTGSASTAVSRYRAYGDSITYGATLPNPSTQAYPVLVAQYEKVTFVNNSRGGDQSCDIPSRQIFPNQDSPTLATHPEYSVLIGTNDVDVKGTGAYEAIFILCHQATISWLGLPLEYKVLATSNAVTSSGTGFIDISNNWNSWTTGAMGSNVSFTIITQQTGPIYAWPRIDDTNPGTYTYKLDGVVVGSGSTETTPLIATQNSTNYSLGFIRFANVPAGKHVVTFTQTSSAPNGVSVVGIGSPAVSTTGTLPTVLIGTIPYQLSGGTTGGACTFSDAPCLEYIKDIEADLDLFSADGLSVKLFDTRQYMFATPPEMDDDLHPSILGQTELAHSLEAAW